MRRAAEMAAQSVIGIGILLALLATIAVACVIGVLLVPYNIARITAWFFEKMIEALAYIIAMIEEWL